MNLKIKPGWGGKTGETVGTCHRGGRERERESQAPHNQLVGGLISMDTGRLQTNGVYLCCVLIPQPSTRVLAHTIDQNFLPSLPAHIPTLSWQQPGSGSTGSNIGNRQYIATQEGVLAYALGHCIFTTHHIIGIPMETSYLALFQRILLFALYWPVIGNSKDNSVAHICVGVICKVFQGIVYN